MEIFLLTYPQGWRIGFYFLKPKMKIQFSDFWDGSSESLCRSKSVWILMSKMRRLARAAVVIDKVIQHCFSIYFHNAFCVQELSRFCLAQVGYGKTLFCAFYFPVSLNPLNNIEGTKWGYRSMLQMQWQPLKSLFPQVFVFPHVGLSGGVSCYDASIK